ncbi:MAG: ATP-binding protein, partial [Jatrophihabitantaceae bacterium]
MINSAPLLGRTTQLTALVEAIDAAAGGAGSVAFVEGEPGIGKTALVDTAVRHAVGSDVRVCRAAALEIESLRPFGVLCDALGIGPDGAGRREREIARLLSIGDGPHPAQGSADGWAVLQFQAAEALLALVDEMSGSGPVVLVVEDLHWADPASLTALARLGHAVASSALFVIGTLRPLPRRAE